MDPDLHQVTREELAFAVKKLRQGIRQNRDSSRQELCWHHPSLWGLLPEKTRSPFEPRVGDYRLNRRRR